MLDDKYAYIVASARTPTGSFQGSLSHLQAIDLGGIVISALISKLPKLNIKEYQTIYFGNVIQSNVGQSPAKQAAIKGGLSQTISATTVNKVCASGLKAIMMGASDISLQMADIVVAGGCESMSNAPLLIERDQNPFNPKRHLKFGEMVIPSFKITDSLQRDGLSDPFNGNSMGLIAEKCSRDYNIDKATQDKFAFNSYEKAIKATRLNKFSNEIIKIDGKLKDKNVTLSLDEETLRFVPSKAKKSRPAFIPDIGTVTSFNSSPMNDGASGVVLVSGLKARERNLKPLAKIISWADAEQSSEEFTTSPAKAIKIALQRAGLTVEDIDFFEINEAFAVVGEVNCQLLGIPDYKINVFGGAVALGHALGSSGCRIVVTLTSILYQEGGRFGVAAVCNGGGGASAIVIENCRNYSKI